MQYNDTMFYLFSAVCMDGSFYRYLFTTDEGQANNRICDSFDTFLTLEMMVFDIEYFAWKDQTYSDYGVHA